jgi:DNA-binding CsgD family transcriptional regulator
MEIAIKLTARENEVLFYIANGYTNKEISSKLGASKRTIDAHRENIRKKLRINSTAELVHYAITTGLISAQMPKQATQTTIER